MKNLPSSLENIIIIFRPALLFHLRSQSRGRLRESAIFIDDGQLIGDIVMESVEHDKESCDTRGEAEDSLIGKTIGFELSIFKGSDPVLLLLTAAIERGEIQI